MRRPFRLAAGTMALFILSTAALCAVPPVWPGDTLRWGTHAEPELVLPLPAAAGWQPGLGVRVGWGLQESVAGTGYWGLEAGVINVPQGPTESLLQPWAGFGWAYPISLGGAIRLSPGIGLGVDMAVGNLPSAALGVLAGFRVEASLPVEFHLGGFRYLRLEPAFSLSSSRAWEGVFSLGLGVRDEHVALLPEAPHPPLKTYLVLSPRLFSPDGDDDADTLTFLTSAGDPHFIGEWQLDVTDPLGNPFRHFGGKGAPPERIVWDGTSDAGELVSAVLEYKVVFTVRDRFGVGVTLRDQVSVDVLVERQPGGQLRLRIPDIAFPEAGTDRNSSAGKIILDSNRPVFARLEQILARYPEWQVLVRGYDNLANWASPSLAAKEQLTEAVPRSLKQAQAVKDSLVLLGVAEKRVLVEGVGGVDPLVPFGDAVNNWKNRRVEIFLRRP